jgi:hypothetical protein
MAQRLTVAGVLRIASTKKPTVGINQRSAIDLISA